jgi:hypothetical protein
MRVSLRRSFTNHGFSWFSQVKPFDEAKLRAIL